MWYIYKNSQIKKRDSQPVPQYFAKGHNLWNKCSLVMHLSVLATESTIFQRNNRSWWQWNFYKNNTGVALKICTECSMVGKHTLLDRHIRQARVLIEYWWTVRKIFFYPTPLVQFWANDLKLVTCCGLGLVQSVLCSKGSIGLRFELSPDHAIPVMYESHYPAYWR